MLDKKWVGYSKVTFLYCMAGVYQADDLTSVYQVIPNLLV